MLFWGHINTITNSSRLCPYLPHNVRFTSCNTLKKDQDMNCAVYVKRYTKYLLEGTSLHKYLQKLCDCFMFIYEGNVESDLWMVSEWSLRW